MLRRTTPVAAIQEGILDNGAIGAQSRRHADMLTMLHHHSSAASYAVWHVLAPLNDHLPSTICWHAPHKPSCRVAEEGEEEGSTSSCSSPSSVAALAGEGDEDDDNDGPGNTLGRSSCLLSVVECIGISGGVIEEYHVASMGVTVQAPQAAWPSNAVRAAQKHVAPNR